MGVVRREWGGVNGEWVGWKVLSFNNSHFPPPNSRFLKVSTTPNSQLPTHTSRYLNVIYNSQLSTPNLLINGEIFVLF